LKPGNDIKSKFLGDGKVQIDQTSSLNLVLKSDATNSRQIQLDLDLNGKLYYPTGKIIDPGQSLPLDLDLSCNFEHLGMNYQKGATESLVFSTGQWSFASPQKSCRDLRLILQMFILRSNRSERAQKNNFYLKGS